MINITKRGWQHIQRHHTNPQFTRHQTKSKFYDTVDLVSLLNEADCYPPSLHDGNLRRVFDAGYPVGIDRGSGRPTSIVTVFTQQNGDLITMFPGHP